MAAVCKYNQTGFCKYKEHCRNLHVNEQCMIENCSAGDGCQLRHPRVCKYFSTLGVCRFKHHCAYLHTEYLHNDILALKEEIRILSIRIEHVVKELEDLKGLHQHSLVSPTEIPQLDGNQSIQIRDTSLLSNARVISSPEPPPICRICDMDFPERDHYLDHDSYQYCCVICGICFRTEDDAKSHEEEFHPEYPGIQPRF